MLGKLDGVLGETKNVNSWSATNVAQYVLQHLPSEDAESPHEVKIREQVIQCFIDLAWTGDKLMKSAEAEWIALLDTKVFPLIKSMIDAKNQPGQRHNPLIMTLYDIWSKLRDCTSGVVWFEAFNRAFKRVQKYDMVYGENETWCQDRAGMAYFSPAGWRRYGFYPRIDTEQQMDEIMNGWHVAYHGTSMLNIDSIVLNGLVPPGAVVDGKAVKQLHGAAGAGGVKMIYVSPSIDYASHYAYANPVETTDPRTGNKAYIYFVLQVRIKPGCFRVQGNTLWDAGWGDKKVPYDLRFGPGELEWLIPGNQSDCIRVTGLMVQKRFVHPHQDVKTRFETNKNKYLNPRGKGKGVWFWNNGSKQTLSLDGPWQAYETKENQKIEETFLIHQTMIFVGDILIKSGTKCRYYIDFEKMEQKRTDDNNLRRKVKREVV